MPNSRIHTPPSRRHCTNCRTVLTHNRSAESNTYALSLQAGNKERLNEKHYAKSLHVLAPPLTSSVTPLGVAALAVHVSHPRHDKVPALALPENSPMQHSTRRPKQRSIDRRVCTLQPYKPALGAASARYPLRGRTTSLHFTYIPSGRKTIYL
jgi:hypothetical protein